MKEKFKSIFSLPILIVKSIRKSSKKNQFLYGLIFGAIFSLVVNILTVHVQEIVQKQRVLEALENEVVSNAILSNFVIEDNLKRIEEGEPPNYYHTPRRYAREVWGTSEALKYIVQLDPEVQMKVTTYYAVTVDRHNEMIEKDVSLAEQKLSNCYFNEGLNKIESEECKKWYHFFLKMEADTAMAVGEKSFDTLEIFHPTQDRLNSPLLRLLMGGKAVRILSGE